LIFSMRVLDVGSVLMQSNAVMAMYSTANICYFERGKVRPIAFL
jgi:hypothetical protein